MASSSDSEPLLGALLRNHERNFERNSDDSDMPSWLKEHQTPIKADPALRISDDDSDEDAGPSSKAQAPQSARPSQAAGKVQQTAAGAESSAAAAAASAAGSALPNPLLSVGGPSEKVVLLPERLIRNKVLIELEPAPHQATELSGDAGAVGRLVASSSTAEDGTFKLDLKGVLYKATIHPLAGTAFVFNIGQTEAKIESVMNDFVRLHEEQSYVGMTTLEGTYDELMADDEDVYQAGAAGDDAKEGGDKPAKKAAAKRSKAGAASKAATASKALKAAKGGVKTKPGAKKAAAKGSKGGSAKSKAAAGKAVKASAAKSPKPGPKAAAAKGSAAKSTSQKKRKQKQSSDDDEDSDMDSDWSGDLT